MRTFFHASFCFLVLPVLANGSAENNFFSDIDYSFFLEQSEYKMHGLYDETAPLEAREWALEQPEYKMHGLHDETVAQEARKWARLYLTELSVRERNIVCTLMKISYQFLDANLSLLRVAMNLFDESCVVQDVIQDKKQHHVFITEDTEYSKRRADEAAGIVKTYKEELEGWRSYADKVSKENNEGILNALKEADSFMATYINNCLKDSIGYFSYEEKIRKSLMQSELVRGPAYSLLDFFKSEDALTHDFNSYLESNFEWTRTYLGNSVESLASFIVMREIFEGYELFLSIRGDLAYVFYEAALPYCQTEEHELVGA